MTIGPFELNPLLPAWRHLVDANGRIAARHARVLWNVRGGVIHGMAVVLYPADAGDHLHAQSEAWHRWWSFDRLFASSHGNCCDDWMRPGGSCPETLFGGLAARGFEDIGEMLRALREFGRIRECDWALTVAAGMEAFSPLPGTAKGLTRRKAVA